MCLRCDYQEQQEAEARGWRRRLSSIQIRGQTDSVSWMGALSNQACVRWGSIAGCIHRHMDRDFMAHTIHPFKLDHSVVFSIFRVTTLQCLHALNC